MFGEISIGKETIYVIKTRASAVVWKQHWRPVTSFPGGHIFIRLVSKIVAIGPTTIRIIIRFRILGIIAWVVRFARIGINKVTSCGIHFIEMGSIGFNGTIQFIVALFHFVIEPGLAQSNFRTAFGCNSNHAVCCPGTIFRGTGSAFDNFNTLNVIGADIPHGAA